MGGKKKQASRTKGNTRPSSSGRSAEKLAATGTSFTGFMGFSNVQRDPTFIPATQGNDELDAIIDAEFRLVMRKMYKKDSVTRLKAVQEFTVLCQNQDLAAVKSILPFWPRIFNKLAMDSERRIREAVFEAIEALILTVQKNIAPYLRSIMGCWLLGQCDNYAPAASAAKNAFLSAFPQAKQTEALIFCKGEILTFLEDHLFNPAMETCSDSEVLTPDELQEKCDRIVTSSLYAWKLFLNSLPEKEHEELIESYKKILSNDLFWKFHKKKCSKIQGAWFSLVSTMFHLLPSLLESVAAKLVPIIFNNLDESDPGVSPHVWESAMNALTYNKDCWQYINISKTLIPKLRHVLRKGGFGNAVVVYSCILPLLKNIPKDCVSGNYQLYGDLFCDMRKGMNLEKVTSSSLELNAIVMCFMECLTHVVIQIDGLQLEDRQRLLVEQLLPVVESSIKENNLRLSSSSDLYKCLAQFLRMLHSSRSKGDDQGKLFGDLDRIFWERFCCFCSEVMKGGNEGEMEHVLQLFLVLQKPDRIFRKASAAKVQFLEPAETPEAQPGKATRRNPARIKSQLKHADEIVSLVDKDDSYFSDKSNPLYSCLQTILNVAMDQALDSHSFAHLKFLSSLCLAYSSSQLLYQLVTQKIPKQESQLVENSSEAFFEKITLPLMKHYHNSFDKNSASTVINLILASYLCAEQTDTKEKILQSISQTENPALIDCLLQTRFNGREEDQIFSNWLKGDELSLALVSISKKLCLSLTDESECTSSSEIDIIWSILSYILSADGNFECAISSNCVGHILNLFQSVLPKPGVSSNSRQKVEAGLQFVCDLATRIFLNFKGCWQISTTEDLLLNFFFLTCDPPPTLSGNCLEKIRATLDSGIVALLESKSCTDAEDGFLKKAFSYIQKLSEKNFVNELLIEASLKLVCQYKQHTNRHQSPTNASAGMSSCIQLLMTVFPLENVWEQLRNQLGDGWYVKATMDGTIVILKNLPAIESVLLPNTNLPHLHAAFFAGRLLCRLLESDLFLELKNEENVDFLPFLLHLREILAACTFCNVMKNGDHFKSYDKNLFFVDSAHKRWNSICNEMTENFVFLVGKLKPCVLETFFTDVVSLSLAEGYLWSLALNFLCAHVNNFSIRSLNIWTSLCLSDINVDDMGKFHTIQVLDEVPLTEGNVEELVSLIITGNCLQETETQICRIATLNKFLRLIPRSRNVESMVELLIDTLISWRDSEDSFFLFDCELDSLKESVINLNAAVEQLLVSIITSYADLLQRNHWDFILCGLYSWIQTCFEHEFTNWNNAYLANLVRCSCNLLRQVCHVVTETEPQVSLKHSSLKTEWDEFFSDGIFSILFPIGVHSAEKISIHQPTYLEKEILDILMLTLELVPSTCLERLKLLAKPETECNDSDNPHIPVDLRTLLCHLIPLLNSSVRSVQLCVYKIIQKIIPLLKKYEEQLERIDDHEHNSRQLPFPLRFILTETTAIVNSCIAEMQVANIAYIYPGSGAYTFTLGYLLSWSIVMELFSLSSSELRSEYASYLQHSGLMQDLLANLFYLISENASMLETTSNSSDSPLKGSASKTLFSEQPAFQVSNSESILELVNQACQVYFQAVKKLPVLVRQWWNNQDKRISVLVDKITSKYITPLLCIEEFQHIQNSEKKFENMTVRARLSGREVVATYMIDEVSMELIVKLSPNHPLGPVAVECGRRVGVGNTQWRNWMLQLNTFLIHQNGSILDGLILWKRNVDKKFEGIEECYICFYILHGSNCQLPHLSCRTCKKKFHSACLYKWFNTSNQSTCPLCRNIF